MSRLLLDLGNTRLKWSLVDDGDVADLGVVQALAHGGPDFVPALAQRLRSLPELASAHLVSVAGAELTAAVTEVVESVARIREGRLRRARTQSRAGELVCAYSDPSRLGTDRWLALRGALRLQRPPLLVVSAGSALTLDAIAEDGRHLGGLILAGIEAMRDGLLRRAPHLQVSAWTPVSEPFWATDTGPAMAIAPWQAAAGLIERAHRRLQAEAGTAPALLLAGGNAEGLVPLLDLPVQLHPDLVLLGLLEAALDPQE
jgi:type III pantothenate kinase